MPIDFENEIIKSSLYSSKSEKEKYPIEIKEEIQESVNIFENITQMTLTQEDQIKELEEKKQSEKYLQALYKCEKCAQSFGLEICLKRHMMKHDEVVIYSF